MAATRRRRVVSPGVPAQQDEADILEEMGAVRDEDTGDLVVDQERILEVGAVDAESVRDNRRTAEIVNKNRGGANAGFNIDDMLAKYEGIIKSWPPNTLDVSMKSLTGSQATYVIKSHPRSGVELYDAIMERHGQQGEAKYEIAVFDSSGKVWRGKGQITMPDTRPATPQQGQQPMMYPPPQYAPLPAQSPAPLAHVAQSPQAALDPSSMMTMMQQMIGMIDQMRSTAQPTPPLQPAPPAWHPPPAPQMPAPLAPGATPAEMMTWMQQMVGMVDQMRSTAVAPPPPPSPPQYQAPPPPPPPPQSGMAETLATMESMFKLFQRMQPPSATPPAGPFRGPRPAYGGDQGPAYQDRASQPQYQPPVPPPREKSPQDLMRDAMGTIRMVTAAAQEMQSLFPGQESQEAQPVETDEDAPIRIVDTGVGKLVMDSKDGTLRKMETFMTAAPGIMKWVSEQAEVFRKAQIDRQARQQPLAQRLAPGYVEVGPGYQPPPGYVAVPVDQLPPPPEDVPPPITPEPPQGWTWGAPAIPDQRED